MRDPEQGASAVEFALVASLLFMIVFGIIQFGIAYNRVQGLHAGGREGARLGALTDTTVDAIRKRVKDSVSIVDPSNLENTCPGTLGTEKGCIEVYRSTSNSGLCPGANCTLMSAVTDKPCSGATSERVVVQVKYRMQITVVFVASFTPTVTGVGDFVCENGS